MSAEIYAEGERGTIGQTLSYIIFNDQYSFHQYVDSKKQQHSYLKQMHVL